MQAASSCRRFGCSLPERTVIQDSSVGIATRYWLEGPGIESRWWRDFPCSSRPALSPLYNGYWVFFSGGKAAGAWRWPPAPSIAEVKERVELYLYSPLWAFVACSRVNFTITYFNFTVTDDVLTGIQTIFFIHQLRATYGATWIISMSPC